MSDLVTPLAVHTLGCSGRSSSHPSIQPPIPKTPKNQQLATDQELSNEEKARKLEVLIPTLNNLGSARMKAQRFEQAYVVARSVS